MLGGLGLIFTTPPSSSPGRAWTHPQGSQGPCLSLSPLCSVSKTFLILPVTIPAFTVPPPTHTLRFLLPTLSPHFSPFLSGFLTVWIHLWTSLPRLAVLPFPVVLSPLSLIPPSLAGSLGPFPSLFSLPSFSLLSSSVAPFLPLFPFLCHSVFVLPCHGYFISLCLCFSPSVPLLLLPPVSLSLSVSLASALMVLPPVSIFIPLTHPLCPLLCLSLPSQFSSGPSSWSQLVGGR